MRARKSPCSVTENTFRRAPRHNPGVRILLVALIALALPATALAEPKTVKPDRPAIDRLLDEFIPAAVSHAEWMKGNTSVQKYPAKGTKFRGWTVNYSYPGDVGFDILLQPTTPSLGAWSFRAEARRIHGQWK